MKHERCGAILRVGFEHVVEHIRNGKLIDVETVHNLVPTEGLNHILNVALRAGSPTPNWYVALFEGNYTPVAGLTAATFPSAATECTAYDEANRVLWVPAAASGGIVTNAASKAVFTMNATKTVYGVVMSSLLTKGGTTGTLVSAVRFASSKSVFDDDLLQVTSSITMTSS
ncbi:MAG: hypothetical protein V5B60_18740 [Accumulibacter sp.]|jgi:hypothetical protein|uniref:hypothetical protein n=1 Tax=Accumulibacter sp. TaxID=2053492 RepID=UPI002FC3A8B0